MPAAAGEWLEVRTHWHTSSIPAPRNTQEKLKCFLQRFGQRQTSERTSSIKASRKKIAFQSRLKTGKLCVYYFVDRFPIRI